ncbi:hypothetical protein J6590_040373 [Homalodisca vitripennis]|nr:hypothetical protein J6590_040373 [Homalodisca vitripennis]
MGKVGSRGFTLRSHEEEPALFQPRQKDMGQQSLISRLSTAFNTRGAPPTATVIVRSRILIAVDTNRSILPTQYLYICDLHNIYSSVAGNIGWWHRFENENLMILLAVIAGTILMVIIICIIIIIVCRRKRAADKCKYSGTCTEISLVETLYTCD